MIESSARHKFYIELNTTLRSQLISLKVRSKEVFGKCYINMNGGLSDDVVSLFMECYS